MDGLALQIDGKWAVLDEDTSVSIESNSPVWGDGNSFSFAFSIDVEANRHIIGNSDQLTGQSVYEVLDGKRAVLYTLGIPTYYGKIQLEDEVEIDEGHVDITLVSGNLTFDEMIDGMNCQDVELIDEIVIGERVSEFTSYIMSWDNDEVLTEASSYFPTYFMRMEDNGVSTVNEVNPYPISKYCNIRICYPLPEENSSGEDFDYVSEAESYAPVIKEKIDKVINEGSFGKYVVLEADRNLSGICFYVLYFLDCLFKKLGYSFDHTQISYMEDMNRLAFCSTRCAYDEKDSGEVVGRPEVVEILDGTFIDGMFYGATGVGYQTMKAPLKKCVANSKNFPDEEVSSIIEGLENGFGIRFLVDDRINHMECVYLKDILRDSTVKEINSVEIYEAIKVENNINGFQIKYSSGSDDDTNYNYKDWGTNVVLTESFHYIMSSVSAYNKNLYIDTTNGNAYRIKIDKDATTSEDRNPTLVEVGAFNMAEYGDCSNEDTTESVEINFAPVVMNDVAFTKRRSVIRGSRSDSGRTSDATNSDQTFAYFVDVSMMYPSCPKKIKIASLIGRTLYELSYTYLDLQRFDESRPDQSMQALRESIYNRKGVGKYITAEQLDNESPIQSNDNGFMLGIMRGPGSTSGVEEFAENYDGENNFRYVMTSKNSAFHSDTIDNYSRVFDYNGTEEEGVDVSGRFSLKLRAEKPNPNAAEGENPFYPITESYAQKRGLFDKFYTEYAYFVVNRKIVKMTCRMEMADILNIDWTKRYKIGDYVGFINKYSYTIDSSGMSDVTLEMYYL